ncbi:hypothetical protein Scep_002456 [Stephania cephalantha]|uniref:Uncharacterized protein n=1 Tax=Stephania cephalantha TaxID=152367 RepID=A0AAP0LCR5_9MAGN
MSMDLHSLFECLRAKSVRKVTPEGDSQSEPHLESLDWLVVDERRVFGALLVTYVYDNLKIQLAFIALSRLRAAAASLQL